MKPPGMLPRLSEIADINIGRVYHPRAPEGDIHYETFARLAVFFGRNTPVHRHQSFFQVHILTEGTIHLDLDGAAFGGSAPAIIFTPPSVPHSFWSDEHTDGHVLTIRQDLVRDWFRDIPGPWSDDLLRAPAFVTIASDDREGGAEFDALAATSGLIAREFGGEQVGRSIALKSLAQSLFVNLTRLLAAHPSSVSTGHSRTAEVALFMRFCDLIEAHFREHISLTNYADRLAVSETRLAGICRRIAGEPPKEIVHERLAQEAKRLLRFTDVPVSEICYRLGFVDPAYFSRFFTKRTGRSPSRFRLEDAF
ncbi:MAG: 4-hydroxyphenylacetate catabolism regulatory protein HpaA [Ancalomicrobiaceae bacterium]|nr:4-hydroxyphenylacetate catabolism regulatory protein HpaA [Ancalomicrobiaceae bacterium]